MYDQPSSSKRGIILGESNVIMMSYCHFLKIFFQYDFLDIYFFKCFQRLMLQLIVLMKNCFLLNVINLNR